MMQRIEKTFAGRKLVIETGRMAKQAAGSAVVQFGDTMVIAACTVSDKEATLPFFPLLVEYREKTYAAGKIPGGFIKREGRPHDHEILAARVIDRSIRPLFPEGFKNEVQVFIYVVSADQENDADVLGTRRRVVCASTHRASRSWDPSPAFAWAACRKSGYSIPPSSSSSTAIWTSSSPAQPTRSSWSRAARLQVSEDDVVEALQVAHGGIQELIATQEELLAKIDRPAKMAWTKAELPEGLEARVKKIAEPQDRRGDQPEGQAHPRTGRRTREGRGRRAVEGGVSRQRRRRESGARRRRVRRPPLAGARHRAARRRPQGRPRCAPITIDTPVLPRAHGSALFTRGQTQALVRRHARHGQRRTAAGLDRRTVGIDQVVHAALQLPAVLDR